METFGVRAKRVVTLVVIGLAALAGRQPSAVSAEAEPAALPLHDHVRARIFLPTWPAPGLTLHVAPTGSDAAPGTARQPFASLERARDEIRQRRAKGGLPKNGVEVLIDGGQYQVGETFKLAEADSGTPTAPVIFRAARGAKPVFRGGARLTGWRRLTDRDGYPQLPEESRAHIWLVDLGGNGITNLLPLKLGGFGSGNGFTTHPAHELFFNGQAMRLARGPNEGFLHIKDVAVKDGTKGYDRQGSKTGKFYYEGDRPSRWAQEPDLLLYGYWFWDWADSYERVASIDPEQRLITLAPPGHHYGFSIGAPFYAVNALSELDEPGEWYLDRNARRALLYAPSDPQKATVELSTWAAPVLELDNVSWVRFESVVWELGSADAIHVRGGSHCLFAGCVVRHFAGNGIEIHGGDGHGIYSCDIYSLGRGGTIVEGGDRRTLTPGGHFVENCDIHDLSRIDHTYTPAVILEGVGNHVSHNRFHNIRSSALRVGGNDHLLEYNEVYNVVTESDDQGAVDMFGNPTFRGNIYRHNYFHHVGNWRGIGEQPKCGQAGIRLDDAICGTQIYGNVFERCSAGKLGFGGVQIHGGKDNIVENNLFIDCAAALSFTPWQAPRWRQYVSTVLDSGEINRELYLHRYPELTRLAEDPNVNHIHGNLAWHCGQLFRRAPGNLDAARNEILTDVRGPGAELRVTHPGFKPIPFKEIGLYRDRGFRPR